MSLHQRIFNATSIVWEMSKEKKLPNYNNHLKRILDNQQLAKDYYLKKNPIIKSTELEIQYKGFTQPVINDINTKYEPPKLNFISEDHLNLLKQSENQKLIYEKEYELKMLKKEIDNIKKEIKLTNENQISNKKILENLESEKVVKIPGK